MSVQPAALDRLFSTGKVRYARAVSRRAPARWGLAEVAGRFVELCGQGASANLTVAAGLVRDAQAAREPVAWIAPPASTFYPPDLSDFGVDLGALAVVRAPDQMSALRAADELLRSGAFGLVVLDGLEPRTMPMAAQVRLSNLAQQHDAAFVCLCRLVGGGPAVGPAVGSAFGSLASLRAVTFCRPITGCGGGAGGAGAAGRFEYGFEVLKDKRRGRRWSWKAECEGPPGLG